MPLIYRVVRGPRCTTAHINEFAAFLVSGGQVTGNGLISLLRQAPFLAVCRDGHELVGFAGIKEPRQSYVTRIFGAANYQVHPAIYDRELGWAYTNPLHQGHGICRELFSRLLNRIPNRLIYTTTEVKAGPLRGMRKILPEFGFHIVGQPYPASDPKKQMQLYVTSQ